MARPASPLNAELLAGSAAILAWNAGKEHTGSQVNNRASNHFIIRNFDCRVVDAAGCPCPRRAASISQGDLHRRLAPEASLPITRHADSTARLPAGAERRVAAHHLAAELLRDFR